MTFYRTMYNSKKDTFMKDRRLIKFGIDVVLLTLCIPIAYILRLEGQWISFIPDIKTFLLFALPLIALTVYFFDFHGQSYHNIGISDLFKVSIGTISLTCLLYIPALLLRPIVAVPLSVPLIFAIVAIGILGSVRLIVRLRFDYHRTLGISKSLQPAIKVLIVGAGAAGNLLLKEILRNSNGEMIPVGFLDDDPGKRKIKFSGVPVLGCLNDISDLVHKFKVDLVIIAMPTAPGEVIRKVVNLTKISGAKFQIVPSLYELLSGKFSISQLREVNVEDLLQRAPIKLDVKAYTEYISDRVVLVTGAGGSIGSELVRQIINFNPKQIVLLGRGENSIFKITAECRSNFPDLNLVSLITDVKDRNSLENTFVRFRPQIVFHAAAHKHVSLMEQNPEQAILNNVVGTKNIVDLSLKYNVERLVNISTDKSVNPTSVMGASKRIAEFVVKWGSLYTKNNQAFVSVRFGNVLGSKNSVIPIFKQQIKNGGPITITHPDMTRYFMTIPEASRLVIQAGGLSGNGSFYILDMGKPVKITDLALDLIRLSGLTPGKDIEIVYTGAKPGEKLSEELLTSSEIENSTNHKKIYSAKVSDLPENFESMLNDLLNIAKTNDGVAIRKQLRLMIPSYCFNNEEVTVQ